MVGSGVWEDVSAPLHSAVAGGTYLGAQLYVSYNGKTLCDDAVGDWLPGVPLTPDHPMPWICTSKPYTAIALARLIERGELTYDTPVSAVVPEFAQAGKSGVTLHHLLTHTVAYAHSGEAPSGELGGWKAALADVCASGMDAPPGTRARYSAFASWLVLGEVISRVSGQRFHSHMQESVLGPLDMTGTAYRKPAGTPAPGLFERTDTGFSASNIAPPDAFDAWPGTGLWGPARELARAVECVVADGRWGPARLLSPRSVAQLSTTCRQGLPDEYFENIPLRWGRGFCTDHVWLGAPADARVVGHTGMLSSLVVGDLDLGLVVAFASNTAVPTERGVHRRIENRIVRHIYDIVT
jgi:CubicO group peptidase (beta-lactamase class C family)